MGLALLLVVVAGQSYLLVRLDQRMDAANKTAADGRRRTDAALGQTVTTGVISALRDNADGPVVQFDAPINPGNSGGPVIDARRQVVGIATAKAAAAEGIGLAIPITVACTTFGNC